MNQTYTDINDTISEIIGFWVVSTNGVTGITQSDLTFSANSVTVAHRRTRWDPSASVTARMEFASVVPEPGGLALAGLGLAALAASSRRRRPRG